MSFIINLLFVCLAIIIPEIWANENESQTIKIALPDKINLNDLNFFQIFELESMTQHKILIRNLNNSNQHIFGLLEVHSFLFPVGLETSAGDITNGTNIGFIVQKDGEFILTNTNNFIKVEAAIAFVPMNHTTAPLPSGCVETGPMLKISGVVDDETDIVRVSAPAAASANSPDCVSNEGVSYESRYKYLRVGDMSSNTYFEGIKDMITADGARKHGKLNDLAFSEGNETVSLFAKIKGTGIVFQTLALDYGGRSVYIPAVTYSCNVHAWNSDCTKPDPLSLAFYIVVIIISVPMMTRTLLPRTINHLSVGMGTGLSLGTFLTIFIDMEMNWKAFVTIFCSLAWTGLNYVSNKRCPKISHYLTSCWLCYISSLTLFFVARFSFNLVDYQYIFLVAFAIIGAIIVATRDQIDIQCSIVLGGFLFMFAISFFTNGHLNNIIEQPYYLAKDFTYLQAVKRLLIAPQDAIAFCLAVVLIVCIIVSYNRYGNIWEKMLEREKLLRARRVAQGGGTFHERLQVASEQTPLITRFTETEEDDVFESPNTNRELYNRIKGCKK